MEALNYYWKDDNKIKKLLTGNYKEILTPKEFILGEFARKLTINLEEFEENYFVLQLKEFGLSNSAILDFVLVVAYFNFVNRIVLALGIELEKDEGKVYNY